MLRSLCYTGVGQAATLSPSRAPREPAHQDSTEIIAISIVIFISIFSFIFLFLLVFIFILIFIRFQAGGSPPTSRIILGN